MQALGFAETLAPTAIAIALAILVPFVSTRALAWVYLGRDPADGSDAAFHAAARGAMPFEVALAGLAGMRCLGPAILPSRDGGWAMASGVAFAALAFAASALARRRWARASSGPNDGARRPVMTSALLGAGIGAVLLAVPVAVVAATDVSADDARTLDDRGARLRLALAPWDGEAWVALAWRLRESEALDRAEAALDAARRAEADDEARLVAVAEVTAARGDCRAAAAAFQASLEAQADALLDPEAPGRASLTLGDYDLPPTLVRRCDLTVGEAFGDQASDDEGNVRFGVHRTP